MTRIELISECVVIRVDFVRAGASREAWKVAGGARVINLEKARLARSTAEARPSPQPQPRRPRGGFPGGFGEPF